MAKYPIYLELENKRVVIVGGGRVALRKAEALLQTHARLVVIAAQTGEMMMSLCKSHRAELIRAKYSKQFLTGALLVIAATNDPKLNQTIYRDAQQLEILCNVVDQPDLCDFYVPAVIKRNNLQIAICTDGKCPAYAGHLKKQLEKIITDQNGEFLAELENQRSRIIDQIDEQADRKAVLGQLVRDDSYEFFIKNGPDAWRDRAGKIIHEYQAAG